MMLEVAIHNERQHRQLRHAGGALRLARTDWGASLWQEVQDSSLAGADALVEIIREPQGIRLAATGCEAARGDTDSGRMPSAHPLPLRYLVGDTWMEIVDGAARAEAPSRRLERLLPSKDAPREPDRSSAKALLAGLAPETVARWFAMLGSLNRSPVCVQELFLHAARSAVDSIGLDGAIILRHRGDDWEIAASYLPRPELGIWCDTQVLDELVRTGETLFHGAASSPSDHGAGQSSMASVVVAPLRDKRGKLIGALYGYRSVREENARRGIRYLEAHLIELLASAVSEGMLRLAEEGAADRRQVLREQAAGASPQARRNYSEQREVTLLFADLRDFSRLSETLETEQLFELLSQAMDTLTEAVMEYDGFVIDYYGDGLAAMWNAPADQAAHGELACRAALQMLERLPEVSDDWAQWLGGRLRLGIGVHTGGVQVGNSGSRQRLKYGPRGASVHIAHRIEAATKLVGVPLLLSETVASQLSGRLAVYRICRGELSGIHRALNLYGIVPPAWGECSGEAEAYERALRHFEASRFEQALFELSKLGADPNVPVDFLREQIEHAMGVREGRRQTDRTSRASNGVVKLRVK